MRRNFHIVPLAVAVALIVSGCSYTPPKGMEITQTTYSDPMALYEACGQFGSCAETDFKTYCRMHLRQAWNGDPLSVDHEISECSGRIDQPIRESE